MRVTRTFMEATAVSESQYPAGGLPEIAFLGRSNAGKSSLINTLTGTREARTSARPGKTRTINFYNVNALMYLVDLPGYGYAEAPKSEQAKWGAMIEGYLKRRGVLKAAVLLVDIRHAPSALDTLMLDWLSYYRIKTIIVAAKADKVKRSALRGRLAAIAGALHKDADGDIIPFSAVSGSGKDALWKAICLAAGTNPQ